MKDLLVGVLLTCVIPWNLSAQAAAAGRAPAAYSGVALETDQDPMFNALRWRSIGPYRGGRVVAVTGDYEDPLVFYFGAVNGGVWKTTNAGQSWTNITDEKTDISSVGAIAVAPSDQNVIWVGTGEGKPREDLTYGTGVYRSTDRGDTWRHLGLTDTQQIADLAVDPNDPDRAFVAALGHAFGPNENRGVFRTTDGGATWEKVLYLDDSTGAADLSMDPTNPRILFAAMWRYRRLPWGLDAGGGLSGLYRSTDGGDSWEDISDNEGLPKSILGRIGVAVSPADPRRVYATVEAPEDDDDEMQGGIFRSDDGGDTWTHVSDDQKWMVRAWYYSKITADPVDPNTVYVLNVGTWRSIDGGRNWSRIQVPHGDTHMLWIDPNDADRMIHGNDGGGTVTLDGTRTWSSIYNQPTAQFYHVTTDDQWPYRVYGAQQDNSPISIASRSDARGIDRQDWFPVAGCESAHVSIDPRNPDITYGGCFMGSLSRFDAGTNQQRNISVGLPNYDGIPASDIPHRFAWSFPTVISPHDPDVLYVTSQNVWRSTNEGQTWDSISPDLSRADPSTLGPSGGPIHYDMTGTEWYASIVAFDESPLEQGLLWAGSDDGLVHVSRDGGGSWTDVTPPAIEPFTRISRIEPGRHDPATAYIAANRYQLDDFTPYLFRTTDYGESWTPIAAGIPAGAYARSIREDPERQGLLFAGTETGVYVSFDDGSSWQSIQLNLPRASVRDLRVKDADVVVATHGRSFWVLDDISILRGLDVVPDGEPHIFAPSDAVRSTAGRSLVSGPVGENPPAGAVVDFYLPEEPADEITLEFLDDTGEVLRSFSSKPEPAADSADVDPALAARARGESVPPQYRALVETPDSLGVTPADSIVPTRPGTNRFVWNLRTPGVKMLEGIVLDLGTLNGPMIPPGNYSARLTIGDASYEQPLTVIADPRVEASTADLVAAYEAARAVVDTLNGLGNSVRRIQHLKDQLEARVAQTKEEAFGEQVADAATPLGEQLEAVRAELVSVHSEVDQSILHFPVKLYNQLITLNSNIQTADTRPTDTQTELYAELSSELAVHLRTLQAIEAQELADFNRLLEELGVPAVGWPEAARPLVP
jgi:photosystem II stability/assembly factor-like uncharacterized protein